MWRSGKGHRNLFSLLLTLAVSLVPIFGQTKPAFVAVGTATTLASGLASYGMGHIAANSLGDVFYFDQKGNTAYYIPHGTTTPVALFTMSGLSAGGSGARSAYVDSSNNAYFPINYSGYVMKVPYSSGGYTTGASYASAPSACTSTSTTPCKAFSASVVTNSSSVYGGYCQPTDMGMDSSGNVYLLEASDSSGTSGNKVLKLTPATTSGTLTYTAALLANMGTANVNAEIAVDSSGDVYYAKSGTTISVIPSGSTTATSFGSFTTAVGVSVDPYGNLFVPDSSTYAFSVFPAVSGVPSTSVQYTAFYGYTGYGIAFDGQGHYFFAGYSGGNTMNRNSIYGVNFGSGTVGTSLGTKTLTLTFAGSYTPATYQISSLSPAAFSYTAGSCVAGAAKSQGANCTVNVSYTPTAVGLQKGELVLLDSSGSQIGAVPLSGIGTGTIQTVDPGVQTSFGSSWKTPMGIDVDSSGAIYVADAGANAVYRYASTSDTAPATVGTGLSAPRDVKVDAAGNVYIADSGNGRVVKVPIVSGSLSSSGQTTLYSSTSSNTGLALDLLNNLYIADAGNSRILEIASAAGSPNASFIRTVGSGFTYPVALSTDSSGNVYVVDQGNSSSNDVYEIVSAGGAQNALGTGYSSPAGIAVDASGSVYVGDTGNDRLLKVPSEGGSINPNDATSVGGSIAAPHGVAVDGSGNLYVTDSTNSTVALITRTSGVLALGSANLNTTTSQQTAEISNAGNSTMTLGSTAYTQSGDTSYFTLSTSSSTGCTASLALTSGSACTVAATFTPTVQGSFSDVLTFSSNATNSSTSTLTITGKGTYIAPTTLSIAKTSPTGTPVYGDSITIQASLAYTANGSYTPSGSITFYVDGAQYKQAVTISGTTASIAISGLTAGSHTFGASYGGDDYYAASSADTISVTISKLTSAVTITGLGGSVYYYPTSAATGASVIYTATITAQTAAQPTGTVSFYTGSTLIGTATVSGNSSVYTAVLTTTSTPAGQDAVYAVYSGDTNYLTSTSSTVSIDITSTAFAITPTTGTITTTAGSSGSLTLTAISYAGYGGILSFSCSGLPAYSQCSFSPTNFSLTASSDSSTSTQQSLTLTILTSSAATKTPTTVGSLLHPGSGSPVLLVLLAPLGLLGLRRSRKSLRNVLGIFLLTGLLAGSVTCMTACSNTLTNITSKGTYTVNVTAYGTNTSSSATTTQTATVTLVVQ